MNRRYAIYQDGVVINYILCDDPEFAARLGGVEAPYPEHDPEPEPEPEGDIWDELAEAIKSGVNGID